MEGAHADRAVTGERSPSLGIDEGLPPDVRAAFDRRWQRVADCIGLRTPDRMPVSLIAGFWFARYGGISCRQLMYDHETANAISERAMLEFEPDIAGSSYLGLAASAYLFQLPGVTVQAPYDVLADYMRGAKNMMTDLYRRPDQVLAALDKLGALILKRTLAAVAPRSSPVIIIPIHWAPDNFMSPRQFATFYWPSFRRLMLALIDHGLVPMPLWESDCTRRLEVIADVPPGKCIYWFEGTDMVRAFEVLGDRVALHGNLGASLLTTGTPEQVDAAVRHLAENVFHKGGKLILSTWSPMPDETPVENVRAMFSAARKYGG